MLISLHELVDKYNIRLKGILHVGAHECEELRIYENYIERNQVLWIEAMEDKVKLCRERYPGLRIENAVVSNVEEKVVFNISNNGQSSSILDLGLHSQLYPDIVYVDKKEVQAVPLRSILPNHRDIHFNFINLDIQGAELKALMGMEEYLPNIDYIYTEVNCDDVYRDGALIWEIDMFLERYGFVRMEVKWYGKDKWGDAFYVKMNRK
jgi:FkbM family methyltransferase